MRQLELVIGRTSLEDNVTKIAETIALALDRKNEMLPYIDRIVKILPDIKEMLPLIQADTGSKAICSQIEVLLIRRLAENAELIQERVQHFECLAQEKLEPALDMLLELFDLQYADKQVCRCYLGLYNPFPRNVLTREYWLYYGVSDEIFLRASLHEIDHMILFDKWKEMHGYAEGKEPDYPDILWFLEELAIEPTLNDERIQKIVPIRHQAYDSLKELVIEGESITEHIQEIYDTSSKIEEFLNRSYHFLQYALKERAWLTM